MNRTSIEYLDFSWNPIAMRCTPVSEGCLNCWHLRMCDRMAANPVFSPEVRAAYAGEGPPVLIEKRLEEPLHRKKPSVIGVQFMGDLFHEDVPDEFLWDVLNVMIKSPQHTFILLTKRPGKMAWFFKLFYGKFDATCVAPPANIWLGITAENQRCANERIPILVKTPAAVRFVSVEPMLGPVDPTMVPSENEKYPLLDALTGMRRRRVVGTYCSFDEDAYYAGETHGLDWVIAGFETGPKARRSDFVWAYFLRDKCAETGTPFFWKRAGPGQKTPADLLVRQWFKEMQDGP